MVAKTRKKTTRSSMPMNPGAKPTSKPEAQVPVPDDFEAKLAEGATQTEEIVQVVVEQDTLISQIINGKSYPLEEVLSPTGEPWLMRQPTDAVYDSAAMVREITRRRYALMPEMIEAKDLPASDEWRERQERSIQRTKDQVAELEARKGESKDGITESEDLTLSVMRNLLEQLAAPDEYSYADEMIAKYSSRAFANHILPQLLEWEDGSLVFDQNTEAGKKAWRMFPDDRKAQLRAVYSNVQQLVVLAKNSQSSRASE